MNLVVGHKHSKTDLKRPHRLNLTGLGTLIGFKLSEVPKKYYREFEQPVTTLRGYTYYYPLDLTDFKK